ncbi:bifunctional DNA primase/polymerase [Nocardia sp. NPDC049190]|uniref:bifunctional DNA primase/polymerase n=1 Tax=Nocardia sp. NPDC049190 TaxID=3155650 RepID=UPI0033D52EF9
MHVLDLDTSHGHPPPEHWGPVRNGCEVLARLAQDAGQPLPVPTFEVSTPSGGVHLYYRAPRKPTLRNTIARLGWRIDSRGSAATSWLPGHKYPKAATAESTTGHRSLCPTG